MFPSRGAFVRRHPLAHPRIAALAAMPCILFALAVGAASAELPRGVTRLSGAEAERTGSTIRLRQQPVGGSTLVQVEPSAAGMSLLAISGSGAEVALADQVGELSGTLILAAADGGQLRIPFPGLLAATFAGDGSWLAVIDGRGGLWRVDPASGSGELLADGPFIGSPLIAEDGSLLLLAVPSVEAPYRSRLVRVVPGVDNASSLSDEELVYAVFTLGDGDLAVVSHDPRGTVVHRLAEDGARLLADLGQGSVNVAVAVDGRIAFERGGDRVFVVDAPGAAPRSVGIGSRPCFAPDGSALLVRRGAQALALAVDGSVLATADELAGFAGSAGCLP